MLYINTILLAIAAGWLFSALHIILPWLLGPLVIVMIVNQWTDIPLGLRPFWRNISLLVLGTSLGASFTKSALEEIIDLFPYMIILTILIVGFTLAASWFLAKWTGWDIGTAVLGCLPGGLSQMVLLADEARGVNGSLVTVMQTTRLFFVVTSVPFLAAFLSDQPAEDSIVAESAPSLTTLPAVGILALGSGVWLILFVFKKVHMPIPFLLAPMAAVVLWNLSGFTAFSISTVLMNGAQLILGVYLGLKMRISKESLPVKYLAGIIGINAVLIVFCLLLSYMLHIFMGYPYMDLFLSLAPGGVTEMAITAISVGANAATVTSFHLFRIFFIIFLAAPLVSWWLKRREVHH